jgi:hypothetical protein
MSNTVPIIQTASSDRDFGDLSGLLALLDQPVAHDEDGLRRLMKAISMETCRRSYHR